MQDSITACASADKRRLSCSSVQLLARLFVDFVVSCEWKCWDHVPFFS